MPTNRSAKLDAASFVLGGEIRNRTNTHTHKITKTNKQTVTDISTPCLSACVDKKNGHCYVQTNRVAVAIFIANELEKASTHESAKTQAGNVFVTYESYESYCATLTFDISTTK